MRESFKKLLRGFLQYEDVAIGTAEYPKADIQLWLVYTKEGDVINLSRHECFNMAVRDYVENEPEDAPLGEVMERTDGMMMILEALNELGFDTMEYGPNGYSAWCTHDEYVELPLYRIKELNDELIQLAGKRVEDMADFLQIMKNLTR